MRKILLFVLLLIILLCGYFYFQKDTAQPISQTLTPSTTPITSSTSPTASNSKYCLPSDLEAKLSLEPAAGNVYGTFTLKNISQMNCQVQGNNTILATYDTATINNLAITYMGSIEKEIFELAPNNILYSQVHYPNGPQCSGPTKDALVTFQYKISPEEIVSFINEQGNQSQHIAACNAKTEMTTIQIWNISSMPITK